MAGPQAGAGSPPSSPSTLRHPFVHAEFSLHASLLLSPANEVAMATTAAGTTLLVLASGINNPSRFMKPRLLQDVPGFKYFQTVAQVRIAIVSNLICYST
uniref:Uncharacterized protein n=1 Tax=Leersia perrieri TaxID=77586 RepID=A0A0D9XKM2_9ORYZ